MLPTLALLKRRSKIFSFEEEEAKDDAKRALGDARVVQQIDFKISEVTKDMAAGFAKQETQGNLVLKNQDLARTASKEQSDEMNTNLNTIMKMLKEHGRSSQHYHLMQQDLQVKFAEETRDNVQGVGNGITYQNEAILTLNAKDRQRAAATRPPASAPNRVTTRSQKMHIERLRAAQKQRAEN